MAVGLNISDTISNFAVLQTTTMDEALHREVTAELQLN
jgi:hypothetical protein